MQKVIEELRANLQSLFDRFNAEGSWMSANSSDRMQIWRDIIDSYYVTRVAPHFNAQGNVTRTDFWLLFKWIGYNNGFQYSHTIKVVDYGQDGACLLDLTDDLGRKYHIGLIKNAAQHNYVAAWAQWQQYKAENRELFEKIDADLLAEHIHMAETWDK